MHLYYTPFSNGGRYDSFGTDFARIMRIEPENDVQVLENGTFLIAIHCMDISII